MTQEILKLSQEALAGLKDVEKQVRELVAENKALKEALAQPEQDSTYTYASSLATAIWQKHYMKESPKWKPLDTTEGVLTQIDNMTCGLIKEKPAQPEQEPVAWLLTDKNINSLQVDSIQRLIDRLKHAHHTDIRVRINGHDEWFEADWLKHMVRVTPPQRTERPADCERCNRLEEQAYDLVGKLRVANIKLSMQPQRTWVGLTEERVKEIWLKGKDHGDDWTDVLALARSFEAELKGLNT